MLLSFTVTPRGGSVDLRQEPSVDEGGQQGSGATFAERLRHLVKTVPNDRGEEYSAREIAEEINLRYGEKSVSHTYISNLIAGRSANPTVRAVEMLAGLFGVPVAYFFDESVNRQVDREIELVLALRQAGVQRLALRMAGLSAASLESLIQIVERVRRLEGLDAEPGHPRGRSGPDLQE